MIDNLQELVRMANAESSGTDLVFSSIITWRDKQGLQQKVNKLNAKVQSFCHNYQILLTRMLMF